MKVTLWMAISVDGFIAKSDDNTDFICDDEWQAYQSFVSDVGCVIVGRRTYFELTDEQLFEIQKCQIVVVSGDRNFELRESSHHLADGPKSALDWLENSGFDRAVVAGGGKLNASFLSLGLVDEVILDVEPWILGDGISFSAPIQTDVLMELINIERYGANSVRLHYKIQGK